MTPEEQQELDQHVQAIAKLLYKDADQSRMTNLGEIEVVIREQLQEHVSPQLGVFLSRVSQAPPMDTPAASKAFWASCRSAVSKPKS